MPLITTQYDSAFIEENARRLLQTIMTPYSPSVMNQYVELTNVIKKATLPKNGKKFLLLKILLDHRNPFETNNDFTHKLSGSIIELDVAQLKDVVSTLQQNNGLFRLYDNDQLTSAQRDALISTPNKNAFTQHIIFTKILTQPALLNEIMSSQPTDALPLIHQAIIQNYFDPKSISMPPEFVRSLQTLLTIKELNYAQPNL